MMPAALNLLNQYFFFIFFYNYKMKLIVLFLLIGIIASQSCINCPNQCDGLGRCYGCNSGFFLDNTGSCGRFTPIEDCKTYDVLTGGCFQCFPGNLLSYGICQQLIHNCNYTSNNNTDICTQCNNTYVLVDDINCYSGNVSNCPLGSLPRVLDPSNQGFCQKFQLQKCSTSSDDVSYCKDCLTNYFNLNGVCNNLTNQINCPSNSCQCQYYYKDNVCYQFNIDGCLQSKDKLYCNLCNDTLVAVSGRCFEPVKINDIHCNVLSLGRDICTGCNFQYLLDPNNICVKSFGLCNDPSRSCQSQCNHPNLLYYNGLCYIKDPQCISYDQVGNKCIKCFEGFSLNSNLKCEKSEKCWIYSTSVNANNRNCQKCFTGYQLNINGLTCDRLPSNCRSMNNIGACLTCSNYTELITQQVLASETFPTNLSIVINTTVCVYTTSNCQYYNSFGYCEICKPNYVQLQHVCVPVATNCLVPSDTDKSKCLNCAIGYQVDAVTLLCYPRIEGCIAYDTTSSKQCIRCNQGYVLRNGICFYKDINCLEYNSFGFCIRCGNSLVPYYNQCVFYDPYCYLYDKSGICTLSHAGFSQNVVFDANLQTNYRSFIAFVRNIQSTSSSSAGSGSGAASGSGSGSAGSGSAGSGSAGSGSAGYVELQNYGGYYTAQGSIRVLPTIGLYNSRILQYDLNGKIRYCREGYTLINDNCALKIDYCSQYSSSNGFCVKCNPFYHMGIGRKCIATSSLICLIPTSTGQYCSKCGTGYTLVNGQCFFSSLNVNGLTSDGKIASVESGYFIWTRFQISYPYDSNCVDQSEPGVCNQCLQQSDFTQSGMRNVNGKCIIVKQNCARYNGRGLCQLCSNGYYLYYGRCYPNNCLSSSIIDNICLTCPFLLNYESGTCVNKVQSNCLVYQQIINYNTTIRSISCRYCLNGYYLKNDGTCQSMIINCEVTDSQSGRCTQCITGYIIYEQQCIREISGCQIYNRSASYNTCTTCAANSNLLNNQCFSLPPRCLQLNSSGYCAKCSTGYNPIIQSGQSICIFTVQSCITYSRQGRCTVCAKNYVLQNNLCNFYIQGCQTLQNSTCLQCIKGYYLRNGYCILDQYCILVESGTCTKCIDGYQLVNGICKKNSIDNCLIQIKQDCPQCINGFIRIVINGQVYCILRKIVYSGCSVEQYPCGKCENGFELRNDGFCYAQRCQDQQLAMFSQRKCSICYPYYKLDPSGRFCILYNCLSSSCYGSNEIPNGFISTNRTGFIIYINYCTSLYENYKCRTCSSYRQPNTQVEWNLCYPTNCKNRLYNCSGNCYNYFSNLLASDTAVCLADNCQNYYTNGTCSTCNRPYNVINGICLIQGPCVDYNPAINQCRKCLDPYNIISGSCIPKNCTSYSSLDVSICSECGKGFQLTVNKTCQIKYCLYPNQNYPCLQCRIGFSFNSLTGLCQMYNCRNFDYFNDVCLQCQISYNLQNGICIPDQCSRFDQSTYKCLSCNIGYKLNSNNICIVDNCCSFNGLTCAQCCSNYDYVQGLCRSRCKQFSVQGICITCQTGYKINSNGDCVTEISGCVAYSGALCTQCQAGLMLYNGRCIVKFCSNYTELNPTVCIQCHPRFYKLSSGLCYPRNCILFNTSTWTCQQCQFGDSYRYSLINDTSICFTDRCSSYVPSNYICQSCQNNTLNQYQLQTINGSQVCILQCGIYFQLINGECKLKYCSNYYSNGRCAQCAPGYELQISNGYCKLKYCLNYNQQNCIQCNYGFTLDPINNRYCVPINCFNYNIGLEYCSKCQDGYVQEYNLCVLKDCFSFNGQYVCQKCADGFNLTVINTTLICKKTYPNTCSQGYYFSSSKGSCQPISIDFCSYVNPLLPNICLSCFTNYYLWQGICYSLIGCLPYQYSYISGCTKCINGFKLIGNLCVKDYCEQYYSNNTCKYCAQGYFLSNGNCTSYGDSCLKGDVYQGCTVCQDGYQAIQGLCKRLPDFCVSMNRLLICTQCGANYALSNGVCYPKIPNCLNQNGPFCIQCDNLYTVATGQRSCIAKQPIRYCTQPDSTYEYCLACQDGYYIAEGKKACIADHCKVYNPSTYVCIQCANQTINGVVRYYTLKNNDLQGERCILITINFCSVPFDQTSCRTCLQGFTSENGTCRAQFCQTYKPNLQQCNVCINQYYLTSNSTCRRKPDNCQVPFVNGSCSVCKSGYTPNSIRVCIKETDSCDRYDLNGVCTSCMNGYYLTASKMCSRLPDNCLNADQFGRCLQCANPYLLSDRKNCYRPILNCGGYNEIGQCIGCSKGYYLDSNKLCQLLPNNCTRSTSTGICQQCVPGFRLQNGICLKSIDNCSGYQNNNCIACINSYYLINGYCYKLSANCVIVNQQSQCLRCQNAYTLFRGFCYLTIVNCLGYSPLGQCIQCSQGFYVNSLGKCSQIPSNCARVNPNGICLECLSGFILSNGICYRQVSNCLQYDSITNLCRQCNSGYLQIQGKCYRLPQNCITVNTNQTCLSCISGYTLQAGICYINIANCDTYRSIGFCSKCINGYYLTANFTCTTLPQGCSQISPTQGGGCTSCILGYVLQGGICYKQYPNCFLYDQLSRQCRQCTQGYYLLNGFCYQLPAYCTAVNVLKQCTACSNGSYILQNGICYQLIPNCLIYSGSFCTQCQNGYYINSQGTCALPPPNCNNVSQDGSCLKCIDLYYLKGGICYKFDQNCIAYNPTTYYCQLCADNYYLNYQFSCNLLPRNCLSCDPYGNCTSCRNSSFILRSGLCYVNVPQCDIFNQQTLLCGKCLGGFSLRDDGYCYRIIDFCAVYSNLNFNCVKCQDNYVLANNLCITCSDGYYIDTYGQCQPNPPNCKFSNQFGQCIQCLNGFTTMNGICSQQILFCQNYSSDSTGKNTCTQCFIGYYLRNQFTCSRLPNGCSSANSTGFCLQCFQGYALNSNGICYTVVPFCQSYQLSSGICLQCLPNYYLNINQICTQILSNNCLFANSLGQCIQCVNNFVLVNSVCYEAIPYCYNHSTSSYTCLQCIQGYYLFNKTCYRMPIGCLSITNQTCTSCSQGYQLINGLCQLIDGVNCIKYQLLTGICTQCKVGYYLASNNLCVKLADNCQQANSQGLCTVCISGWILNNGICYKDVPNCSRWSSNTCMQCIDQFYLQNGLCYKYPDYCQSFDTTSLTCLQCISGYQLSFGRCMISVSTNCLYNNPSSPSQCYTCKNSFYQHWVNQSTGQVITAITTIDNFCRPYPQYCTNVDLLGNCISCCFGSRLDNGKCIGTNLRSLNCDLFDNLTFKCIKCMVGYYYCQWIAICIEINLNCGNLQQQTQCSICADGFNLVNGNCVRPPPGVSNSNSAICNTGYTYSNTNDYGIGGSCYRNKNELRQISTITTVQFYYTSIRPNINYSSSFSSNSNQQRLTTTVWNPPPFINNYISIISTVTQIVHYIQIQGTSSGYVTSYLIQFRNKQNAPFICWNSCQRVKGNVNGNDVAELRLVHPIVATEIRIYPLTWVGGIWMSLNMLVESQ